MADSKLVTYENLTKNCTTGRTGYGKTYTVDTITIHCTASSSENVTAKAVVDYFATTDRSCGSTYCVGGDGSIGQSTLEKNRPWTTGGDKTVCGKSGSENDYHAVTIETASNSSATVVTDKAIEATIQLCVDIMQRYGKTKAVWFGDNAEKMVSYTPASNEMKFTWHRWFATKSCPGPAIMNKFQYIIDEINKRLGNSESGGDTPVATRTLPYSIRVQRVLPLPYYSQPSTSSKVNGQITSPGTYTIVAESDDKQFGKLKSGVGYVKLTDVDGMDGKPIETPSEKPADDTPANHDEAEALIAEIRTLLDKLETLI